MHIIRSMAWGNGTKGKEFKGEPCSSGRNEVIMAEKVYNTMKSVGAFNLVIGILLIVGGILAGTAVIVNGAKLLNDKSDLTF